MDWVLTVSRILTEPVCPIVIIAPEGSNATRYRVDCDTIEQGISEATERVYREIILGQSIKPIAPFTNPDDAELESWIAVWRRGERVNRDGEPPETEPDKEH